jgi:hypothetical protein
MEAAAAEGEDGEREKRRNEQEPEAARKEGTVGWRTYAHSGGVLIEDSTLSPELD